MPTLLLVYSKLILAAASSALQVAYVLQRHKLLRLSTQGAGKGWERLERELV
jgi:hypothetical protein